MKTFEYVRPQTLREVSRILIEHAGTSKLLGGGTDLLVALLNGNQESPSRVVTLRDVPGLKSIHETKGQGLVVGAMATLREIERSELVNERYPVLSKAAGMIASVQIRNMATLGGNICNASPSADMAPPLICLDAKARLMGSEGERLVSLEDFFTGPGQTVLRPGEWLMEIIVPPMAKGRKATYLKLERSSMDIAIASVGAALTGTRGRVEDVRIAMGAAGPVPFRAKAAEALIEGKSLTPSLVEDAAVSAFGECRAITDLRASESFRREMIKVLTRRALLELAKE